MFCGPMTTKASLESAFNDIKDKGRGSKANRLGAFTRWSYLACNAFAPSGGINTLTVDEADFSKLITRPQEFTDIQSLNVFTGSRGAELPDETPTRKDLQAG